MSKASLSPEGKYCLSKMNNSLTRKFGISLRTELADKKVTPGPGNYKLPSDFGHYVSKKFHDCLKNPGKSNKENVSAA